ncbi:calcium-binding protein, partial [Brevundimonas sp. A19_0]|uniref:calcium-binding protein n=1 Tax=Brevundimonas sp. A19_0 TaxID=2821087 RepID=UPI001B1AA98A|nr:hypothetical protein [Brevundimonas sp. A19_0]
MSQLVTRDFTLGVGQTLHFRDVVSGFLLQSVAPGERSPHLTISGTVTHSTNFPLVTALFDHESGGYFDGGLIEITSTGSAVVSATDIGTAFGYFAGGYGSAFINRGSLSVTALQQAFGIYTHGSDFSAVNAGTLRVQSNTMDAIGIQAMNGIDLTNSGRLEVIGVRLAHGVVSERGGHIDNSGTLIARGAEENVGIVVRHFQAETVSIENTGTIEADIAVLDDSGRYSPPQHAVQTLVNSGTIRGAIDLRLGDDSVSNSGLIEGDVLLGLGADTYIGTGGELRGAVHGGFGADHLVGGDRDDILFGEEGDDVITGGAGNDLIQGGRGTNVIDGGAGRDTLTYTGVLRGVSLDLREGWARGASLDEITGIEDVLGSKWDDTLRGDDHDNLLFGAGGDDTLEGRDGRDVIAGGTGADTLSGGAGDDTFIYGTGDGHDEITDFSAGDRIEIHGYTSAQAIQQVGSDTIIRLSATDSITLLGVNADAWNSGQVVFSAQPRPSFSTTAQPEGFDQTGVALYESLTLAAGEEVVLDGGLGTLALVGNTTETLRLLNGGTIRSFSNADVAAAAVTLAGYGFGPVFENLATGLVAVTSENDDAFAYGVYAQAFQASVINEGRIELTSAHHGAAIFGASSGLNVDNSGEIYANAVGDAYGVNLGTVGGINNSGSITVQGGGANVMGIRVVSGNNVSNAGEISVSSERGTGIGIYMRADAYNITNTGTIDADIAINASGHFSYASGYLLNTGTIRGDVLLGGAPDLVLNEGVLYGPVHMGQGDDQFDGSAGAQGGEIHGGQGQDHIVGGIGIDLLFGDEGSDTLWGGLGDDKLNGGTGDDFAVFSGSQAQYDWSVDGNIVTITGPDGTDVLTDVELLRFDDGLVSLTGFGLRLKGLGGDDVLHGTDLNDVLDGGDIPPLWVANGSDRNGRDQLFGHGGDDILYGGGENDLLDGGSGNDLLDGGTGADQMYGGTGNDTYYADVQQDLVFENAGEGYDTIVASSGFYLYDNIEALTLSSSAGNAFGVGNALDNTLTGNA